MSVLASSLEACVGNSSWALHTLGRALETDEELLPVCRSGKKEFVGVKNAHSQG